MEAFFQPLNYMNPYIMDVVEGRFQNILIKIIILFASSDSFPPVSCEFSVRKKAYICREGSGTPW